MIIMIIYILDTTEAIVFSVKAIITVVASIWWIMLYIHQLLLLLLLHLLLLLLLLLLLQQQHRFVCIAFSCNNWETPYCWGCKESYSCICIEGNWNVCLTIMIIITIIIIIIVIINCIIIIDHHHLHHHHHHLYDVVTGDHLCLKRLTNNSKACK